MHEQELEGPALFGEGVLGEAPELVVREVEEGHVVAGSEDAVPDPLHRVVADVDPGLEEVLESLPADLRDLVLGQVDGVDELQIGKHLEVNLAQLVPRKIDGANPGEGGREKTKKNRVNQRHSRRQRWPREGIVKVVPCLETALKVPLPTLLIWFPAKKSLRMNLIPRSELASRLVRLLSFRCRTRTRPVL